jgi:hypothetical protein
MMATLLLVVDDHLNLYSTPRSRCVWIQSPTLLLLTMETEVCCLNLLCKVIGRVRRVSTY